MAKFCSNCGTQLEDNVKFCANCGQQVAREQAAQPVRQSQEQQARPQTQAAPATLLERPVEQVQPAQYQQQYNAPAAPKKKKGKLKIVLPVIVLALAGIACLVIFVILPFMMNTMAERDFYTIATNDVPTVKYILGEKRTVTGVSATTRSDGFQEQIVTYKSGDDENPQQDMFAYATAICNEHGFYAINDNDFSGVTGKGFQFAKLSKIEGNLVIVQIDYDTNGYTVGLLHGKGTLKIPETSDASLPEIAAESIFDLIDSGTFHMKVVFVGGSSDGVEANVHRKDGITSLIMEGMSMKIKRIEKEDKFYTVLDDDEAVYVQEMNPGEISPLEYDSSGLNHEEEGTGEFDGITYPYSKYVGARGEQLFYFMDGNNLVGIRSISLTGNTVDSKILVLDGNVPDEVLTWPTNYTVVDETVASETPAGPEVGIWRFEIEASLELLILNADGTAEAQVYYVDGAGDSFTVTGTYRFSDGLLTITNLYYDGEQTDGELTFDFEVTGDVAIIDENAYDRVPEKYAAAVLDNPLAPYPPGSDTTQQHPGIPDNTGAMTADVMKTVESGTYRMQLKIMVSETEGMGVDCYFKNDMAAVLMAVEGMSIRVLLKDGKTYTIIDDLKMMTIANSTEDDVAPGSVDTSNLIYVGEGIGDFLGKSYKYDEYKSKDGGQYYYFMDGSSLKGIRTIVNGVTTDTEIIIFEKNVPDDLFEIPTNYTVQDNSVN